MRQLRKHHIQFCEDVASGEIPAVAYRKNFPNAKHSNLAGSASRLLKSALIASKIDEVKGNLARVVERQLNRKAETIAQGSIAGKVERMQILTQIARGKLKVKKSFIVSQGQFAGSSVEENEVEPDFNERIKAIAELNKMDGSYERYKAEISVTENAGKDILYVEYVEVKEVP